MTERKIYVASVGELDIGGTRRVTAEFFNDRNGFNASDRQQIEGLERDRLLLISSRGNSHSIRRVE